MSLIGLVTGFLIVSLSSCVKDEFDAPDNGGCIDAGLQRNITIADLKDLYTGNAFQFQNDYIIEGVVISDDEQGNFYKELIIQDETGGILLLIDQVDLFNVFPPGRKVYVKCKGLVIDDYAGLIQLGGSLDSLSGDLQRIPQSLVSDFIYRGPCDQTVDTLKLAPGQLTGDQHQSMLVKLDLMVMDNNDADVPFANPGGTSAQNRTMVDCNGSSIILRTSDFAYFAGEHTPAERFNILGVFSVFSGDKQFKIRNFKDIEVTGADCPCIPTVGPVSGTTTFELDDVVVVDDQQTELLKEDFETTSDGSPISLTGWKNIAQEGTQVWEGDQFSGNLYARGSAYQSGESNVIIWLITPELDMSGTGETMSFITKDAFDDGAVLEVFISTDYDGSNSPQNSTWEKVCPEISSGHTSNFAPNWTESGAVDLSGYDSNVYVAFRYKGGD